jgi:adenylate cyclase
MRRAPSCTPAGSVRAVDMTPWQAAGLYDPDAPDAAARRDLIEYFVGLGLAADDVAEGVATGRLGRVAADRILWGNEPATYTGSDVAARGPMAEDDVRRIIRAAGLTDGGNEAVFREADARLFEGFAFGTQFFGPDAILQFTRVLGASAARVAEAAVALFLANVSPRLREGNLSDLEQVREAAEAIRAFGLVPHAMEVLVKEHFITAVRRLGVLDVAEGGATLVTIAFVDLVGSTALATEVSATQLTDALSTFEYTAMDAATTHDCRVVKLIGDEVMLAGPSTKAVVAVVDEVLEAVEGHPLLGAGRAGVAAGYAVARDGDYFGPVVNLASRLVGAAGPGEVLVDDAVATSAARDGHATEPAGDYELKGFEQPVPVHRLRR